MRKINSKNMLVRINKKKYYFDREMKNKCRVIYQKYIIERVEEELLFASKNTEIIREM